jgi:AraC family transcriptional regulator, positive regulator of tynA and feaB
MRLAFYDLLGALFAPSGPENTSVHTDRLFGRVREIIKDHFADPGFGPCEVAAEAGISLRYLQKLFTARNSTCSSFIHSVRLDQAARLLERRSFLRKFRRRFGHTPGSHSGDHAELGRIRTAESASLAHDV